jgi:DNA repair exonuclease SbcCD ATPase subunit
MRTTIGFIIAFSFIIVGCGKSPEQTELERQNAQLKQELASKDRFVEDVTSTINDIHNKLENTWAMEKNILRRNPTFEEGKMLSEADMKAKILDRISAISSILSENRKKVANLQHRLAESKTQYAGLSKMADDLKNTLDDREKTIAMMQTQVLHLQSEVTSKTRAIAARDETIAARETAIENQMKQINAVYYVVGKKSELKEKKIVSREGGILWGLLGTTTVLTNTFNEEEFTSLDKSKDMLIEVAGTIDEIVPERDPSSYLKEEKPDHHTLLTITKPEIFWRESHLAIITD